MSLNKLNDLSHESPKSDKSSKLDRAKTAAESALNDFIRLAVETGTYLDGMSQKQIKAEMDLSTARIYISVSRDYRKYGRITKSMLEKLGILERVKRSRKSTKPKYKTVSGEILELRKKLADPKVRLSDTDKYLLLGFVGLANDK